MLFRRYYRKDLKSNAYLNVILRIILAGIGTLVIANVYPVIYPSLNKSIIENETIATIDSLKTKKSTFSKSNSSPTEYTVGDSIKIATGQTPEGSADVIVDHDSISSNDLMENRTVASDFKEGGDITTAKKGFSENSEQQTYLLVIAFIIGAFPPIAWQLITAAFKKITFSELILPSLKTDMPIRDLDGLTIWHEVKLEEEDIENIQNMATANMVDLILNTRYPVNRLVDWVDQAILYTQLGTIGMKKGSEESVILSQRNLLRKHGIRTASTLIAANQKSAKKPSDTADFLNILNGGTGSQMKSLVDTIYSNPNLYLVLDWNGINDYQ